MEAPLSLPRRPGLSELAYGVNMSTVDTNIIILTASLFGVLLLALFTFFFIQWARKHLQSLRMQNVLIKPASPGMTNLQLDALPSKPHVDQLTLDSTSSTSDCAICLADFANGERIRVLPSCHHGFHVGCIDTWLVQESSCPICRESLAEEANVPCKGAKRLVQVRIIISPSHATCLPQIT